MALPEELEISLRVVFFTHDAAQRAQHDLVSMLFATEFELDDSSVEDKLLLFDVHRTKRDPEAAALLPTLEEWAQSFGGNCC